MDGRYIRRRSIVLLLEQDEKTSDEIVSAAVSFLKANYKLKDEQIETHKRTIFVNNYKEV